MLRFEGWAHEQYGPPRGDCSGWAMRPQHLDCSRPEVGPRLQIVSRSSDQISNPDLCSCAGIQLEFEGLTVFSRARLLLLDSPNGSICGAWCSNPGSDLARKMSAINNRLLCERLDLLGLIDELVGRD